jgi:hypothetical protein
LIMIMSKSKSKIKRLLIGVLLVLTVVASFLPALNIVKASDTLFEYYNTGENWYALVGSVVDGQKYVKGQTFTPSTTHYQTSVKIKVYRSPSDNPGDVTLFLFNTSGGIPIAPYKTYKIINGNSIPTTTGGVWVEFVWNTPQLLTAGTKYCIVLTTQNPELNWSGTTSEIPGGNPTYYSGNYVNSTDGGVTFISYSHGDLFFEEYGTLPVTIPTVTTQEVTDITSITATGNGTITSLGNGTVTKRGIVYSSTDSTPTIAKGASYVEETGTFSTGAFTRNLISLSVGTTYYVRAYAYNSAGYGYGNVVTFSPSLSPPAITALAASNVAKTSARLNARVESDGGEACEVRFGWGVNSPATFLDYDNITDWVDSYTSGQQPYIDLTGLNASTKYYYSVQIKNGDSTVTSTDEIDFTTLDLVSPALNFKGIPTATKVELSWVKGAGASKSMLRFSYIDYPATIADGTQVYFDIKNSYTHTGLTAGTNIYYSLWCESGGTYSPVAHLLITTMAGDGQSVDIGKLEQPTNWFLKTDYTSMSNLEPFYGTINSMATYTNMPKDTVWMIVAIMFSVALGFLGFAIGKGSLLYGGISLVGGLGMSVTMSLLPLLTILLVAIAIIAIGLTRRAI